MFHFIKTPLGNIQIEIVDNHIISCNFIGKIKSKDDIIIDNQFVKIIDDYFNLKKQPIFNIKFEGTDFQISVWKSIMNIPIGQTKTYSDIAKDIGKPTSIRAVANACGKNKIALFVPCHRVVRKNDIGGYRWGFQKKQFLLNLEK